MTIIPFGNHEDVLERKCVLLWAFQVRFANENEINVRSLLQIFLYKKIRRLAEEVDS